jgi:hypothetical protein
MAELAAESRRDMDSENVCAEKFWARKYAEQERLYHAEVRTPVYPRYGENALGVPRATRTHKAE